MSNGKFDKASASVAELTERAETAAKRAAQMESEDRDSPEDIALIERLRRHAAVCRAELARRVEIDQDTQCPDHGCARHRCDADH